MSDLTDRARAERLLQAAHDTLGTATPREVEVFVAGAEWAASQLVTDDALRERIEAEVQGLAFLAAQAEGLSFDASQRARGIAYRLAERGLRAALDETAPLVREARDE